MNNLTAELATILAQTQNIAKINDLLDESFYTMVPPASLHRNVSMIMGQESS